MSKQCLFLVKIPQISGHFNSMEQINDDRTKLKIMCLKINASWFKAHALLSIIII